MRFFRIPSFTGIETHRDDADRGSLRTVEGCIPHGPGGLRSSPVWSSLGTVSQVSTNDQNKSSAIDDSSGTSLLFASRNNEVHDVAMIHAVNSVTLSLGHHDYDVINQTLFNDAKAHYAPVGNKLYAFGDGSIDAVMVGKGPWFKSSHNSNRGPDKVLYTQEWSDFPKCQFFVAGPKKTIFASGNPEDPLAVYISEPAGQMQPFRNAPYSTESNVENPGLNSSQQYHPLMQSFNSSDPPYVDGLSLVRILGSNSTRVTALSTRGDKVVVHTDSGCHILFAPSADQAETGYRVEQVAATNTSSAVNSQVVAGDGGTQPFWFGFDGQIYKDSAAARGAEDFKSYSDPQQASWKSKGKWEKEHPNNLENSFATYDPQSGMYWVFVESSESAISVRDPLTGPTAFSASQLMHGNPPVGGPTALTTTLAPTNGPTGLGLVTAPAHGPTGVSELVAPVNGPTGLSAVLSTDICVSNAPQNGTWTLTGTYNGKNYWYTALNGGRYIFWDSSNSYWSYSSSLGGGSGDNDNGGANPWSGTWQTITVTEGTCVSAPVSGPTGLTLTLPPLNGPVGLNLSLPQAPYYGPRFLVTASSANPPVNGPTALQASQYSVANPSILSDNNTVASTTAGDTIYVLAEFGTLFGRGRGIEGQLGQGNYSSSSSFVQMSSGNSVDHVTAGARTCSWIHNGEMYSVGVEQNFGGLGLARGSTLGSWFVNSPTRIAPTYRDVTNGVLSSNLTAPQDMVSCASGYWSGLHVTDTGKLYQYGLGHQMWHGYPTQMTDHGYTDFDRQWTDPVKICRMSAEDTKICTRFFIDDDGHLLSYGYNNDGQLGRDPTVEVNWPQWRYDFYPKKTHIYDVVDVIADAASTYFIKSDGTLWMVGQMNGNSHVPTQIDSNVSYAASSAGIACYGTCATKGNLLYRKTDATLWGMGPNASGELGLGHTNEVTTPQQIDTNVLGVATSIGVTTYVKWKTGNTLGVWQMGNPNDPYNNGTFGSYSDSSGTASMITTPVETGTVTD